MGLPKVKAEGGQGGKRGHSNMVRWEYTEEIKIAARKRGRLDFKKTIKQAVENPERI